MKHFSGILRKTSVLLLAALMMLPMALHIAAADTVVNEISQNYNYKTVAELFDGTMDGWFSGAGTTGYSNIGLKTIDGIPTIAYTQATQTTMTMRKNFVANYSNTSSADLAYVITLWSPYDVNLNSANLNQYRIFFGNCTSISGEYKPFSNDYTIVSRYDLRGSATNSWAGVKAGWNTMVCKFSELDPAVDPKGNNAFFMNYYKYAAGANTGATAFAISSVRIVDMSQTETNPPAVYKGVQSSPVSGNMFNIRFVATIGSLEYDEIGFKITANYTENSASQQRALSTSCRYVYSQLNGKSETGISQYTAENLGGNYLMALGINNIPANIGEITFVVQPYVKLNGAETLGDSYTVIYVNGVFQSQNRT